MFKDCSTILLGVLCLVIVQSGYGQNFQHYVPADKKLSSQWMESLYARDRQTVYRGDQLEMIGMPCGGICAGQLYVRGDGTLARWWIANNAYNTGDGHENLMEFDTAFGPIKVCYRGEKPPAFIDQGFSVQVTTEASIATKTLSEADFDDISFIGEYPIATINYEDSKGFPVKITSEVFSPFIPLNAKDSAIPGTILNHTITNTTDETIKIIFDGWLQNLVALEKKGQINARSVNRATKGDRRSSIEFSLKLQRPEKDEKIIFDEKHPYYGNVCLTVLDADAKGTAERNSQVLEKSVPLGEKLVGNLRSQFSLKPGQSRTVTYLITWYFPNRPKGEGWDGKWNKPNLTTGKYVGNMYANWFDSSGDVANYLHENFDSLTSQTRLFWDTYYRRQSLPYWLIHRLMMPVSNLATETCQWWENDRFWAWEGVGSCYGTCTHVWTYEHAMARLFPELERTVREKQDYGVSFNPQTGGVATRNGRGGDHLDGHAGAILKAYREHLMTGNHDFLNRNWPKIKKSLEYLINLDGNDNGLIEGVQPNTYDISFYGANTYVGGLYLAALKAAAEMAACIGDIEFAERCRTIAKNGSDNSVKKLWSGEYFVQDTTRQKHSRYQYWDGCLSDQMLGQTWAHQLNLGYIYPEEKVKKTLTSIWKFNWTSDVASQNKIHIPERYFAHAGEPGLLICTWPNSEHPGKNGVRYRNEVWTGIEYQVATHMIHEGMLDEGLSMIKAVHERYVPEKHNPWNEVECGDHYARAMASWGCLIALQGFEYDGPAEKIGFSPKLSPEDFTSFFTAAKSWGNISQQRKSNGQINQIAVKYGNLTVQRLYFEVPKGRQVEKIRVKCGHQVVPAAFRQLDAKIAIDLTERCQVDTDETLTVEMDLN